MSQSKLQPVNQPTNQFVSQSVSQSVCLSVCLSLKQSINQLYKQKSGISARPYNNNDNDKDDDCGKWKGESVWYVSSVDTTIGRVKG